MPRSFSRDLRERWLHARASGLSAVQVGRTTGVSPSSLRRWQVREVAGASLDPETLPAVPMTMLAGDEPALCSQVAAMPDATLAKYCVQWPTVTSRPSGGWGCLVAIEPDALPPLAWQADMTRPERSGGPCISARAVMEHVTPSRTPCYPR